MQCGLGIRPELFNQVLDRRPELGFLEAHSENYFGESLSKARLLELRQHYPVSLHGVGLSLGRADDLDVAHLAQLRKLVDDIDPVIVSEHLAWSAYSHRHVPDLLPLPLTKQALSVMCDHVDRMQQAVGRQILVENPSNYLLFDALQMPEPEFLNALAAKTGCGLLLDVNNVFVSAFNVNRDPEQYLAALDSSAIGQYHLAGYTEIQRKVNGQDESLLIDTHDHPVYDPVWELFDFTLQHHGARPTLFEWDSDFPEIDVLLNECGKASERLGRLQQDAKASATSQNHLEGPVAASAGAPQTVEHEPALPLKDFQSQFLDDVFALHSSTEQVRADHHHRIGVYQNNVFGAMQEYIAEVYPATKGVVGDDFFKYIVQLLVQTRPPKQGNVHVYGDALAEMATQIEGADALPYLPDLISLEWAMHQAYYAEVGEILDPTAMPQDQLLSAEVTVNESATMIASQYPIEQIYRQSLPDYEGEVSIHLDQSQDNLLVNKRGFKVNLASLNNAQVALIGKIKEFGNLLQAIEALGGSIEANELSAAMGFIFENQLLVISDTALNDERCSEQDKVVH